MADFVSTLKLDAKGFVRGVKLATAAIDDVPTKTSVAFDTNAAAAAAEIKSIGTAGEQSSKGLASISDKMKGFVGSLSGGGGGGIAGGAADVLGLGAAFAGASAAIGAVTAVLSAVGGALADVYAQGKAVNDELKKIALQTGLSGDALQAVGAAGDEAFRMGLGENVAEATKAVAELKKALGDVIPSDQLASRAAEISKIAEGFGVDQAQIVEAIQSQVKQFGLTAEEAQNLVVSSLQAAPKAAGELLSTYKEFSQNAAEAGLSAEEFSGKIIRGAEGGAFQLSKVGDGIKELNTRLKSGDISTNLSATTGKIGDDLRQIVRDGETGASSAKTVGEEFTNRITAALKVGEITQAKAGELFASAFGAAGEDLGNKLTADIFGGTIDTAKVKANAAKAGADIKAAVANIDPFEKIQRGFTSFTTNIGKFFNSFATAIIGPIIGPFLIAFDEIQAAFTDAFDIEGAGGGLSEAFDFIKGLISKLITNVITPAKETLKTVMTVIGTVFETVRDAVAPVVGSFKELFAAFDAGGESAFSFSDVLGLIGDTIRDVLGVAIKILLIPLKSAFKLIAGGVSIIASLVMWVVEAGKSVAAWVTSFEPLNTALRAVGQFIIDIVERIKGFAAAVGDFLGVTDTTRAAEQNVKKVGDAYGEAAKKAKAAANAAEELRRSQAAAARDVNSLAKAFNDSLAAQQSAVTNFLAGQAQSRQSGDAALSREFIRGAKDAQTRARELEKLQDQGAFAIDPSRQRAIAQQRKDSNNETLKQAALFDAGLIANTRQREQAILDIEQKFAAAALSEQIKTQQTLISAGGAGLPEAQGQLNALNGQLLRATKDNQQQQIELRKKFFDEDLQLAINRETKRKETIIAIAAQTQEFIQRQINFGDLSADSIDAVAGLAVQQVKAQTEGEVRAFIEGTQAFTKGKEELIFKSKISGQSIEETQTQISDLARNLTTAYVDANNDPELQNEYTQSLVDLIKAGELAASDAQLGVFREARARRIEVLQDATIRERETAVSALVAERDDLLQNEKLTQEQRLAIITEYDKRIRRVSAVGIETIADLATGIGKAFATLDLTFTNTAGGAEDVADQIAAINRALAQGEITYQEASAELAKLQSQAGGLVGVLGQIGGQLTAAIAETTRIFAQSQISALRDSIAQLAELKNNALATLQEIEKKEADVNRHREAAYAAVGAAAVGAFLSAITSGEDAGKSLVKVALDTLDALIPILSAQIAGVMFASPASGATLGAAGLVATAVLTGILKGLVATARASSGFMDGGYTGNMGINQVAGVVHGQEFVSTAETVRSSTNRSVLQYMHGGGHAIDWARLNGPDANVQIRDTSLIVAQEIGSLRGEFAGLRGDVQELGVQINRNVSVQGNLVARGGDLVSVIDVHRRKTQMRRQR